MLLGLLSPELLVPEPASSVEEADTGAPGALAHLSVLEE